MGDERFEAPKSAFLAPLTPDPQSLIPSEVSRRQFLALSSASLALAGLGGCSVKPAPSTEIVPYVVAPAGTMVDRPLFYATTMAMAGTAVGLLVESNAGRPTKVEGNPSHPASRGATDIYHQASVLSLYDPDRAKTVTLLGRTRTWADALAAIRPAIERQRARRGAGLRLLTETIVSPTLAGQLEGLFKDLPEAVWHVWEPIHRDTAWRAAQLAFGEPVNPVYDFHQADVVLSLEADFLRCSPGGLHDAAQFMDRRRVRTTTAEADRAAMNRLYVVETAPSCTGAKADHRLALRPEQIEAFARALAAELGVLEGGQSAIPALPLGADRVKGGWDENPDGPQPIVGLSLAGGTRSVAATVAALARDLQTHRGRCLVLAGDGQPPAVHLLMHAINDHLGNVGKTVSYTAPIDARPGDRTQSLRELVTDMERGRVEFLVMLGGNPVYTAPADVAFAKGLAKVPLRIHHGLYVDETSYQCHWHLPEAHYLEAWSDGRAYDGTASLAQPLIEPLYQGRSAHEVVALLTDFRETPGREIVQDHWRRWWQGHHQGGYFEPFWQQVLHDGVVPGTAFESKAVKLKDDWRKGIGDGGLGIRSAHHAKPEASNPQSPTPDPSLAIVFQPDPTIYDGSWANNGWLQELPKPLTKLAWGNAALMSPATAKTLGIALGSYAHGGEHGGYYMPEVELSLGGRRVRGPAWIVPGHADGAVTVYLGHGRPWAGRVGGTAAEPVGFNAYRLRTADQPWSAASLRLVQTGARQLVVCTQAHATMDGRDPVRSSTLAGYREHPRFAAQSEVTEEKALLPAPRREITLYEPFDYGPPKHRWGMVIDLSTCVGCHACVVACQAENNISVVGRDQVSRGREMHWLRVDRYVGGTADEPDGFHFQPVPCMHCENAPCEYVCPVEATVHGDEGLNEMVYNRCVGTRFCSNNCPYKVRRFNFLFFADYETPSRRLQYNPQVTVRSRGVMEKCSYCVQRIRRAEIDGQTEERPLVDGEVLTACQAACPVQAIVFGDLNDARSKVKQWKDSPLHYGLLADINTNPRTTYLAELRNPNPELKDV